MRKLVRRAWVEVDLDAICCNYNLLSGQLEPHTRIMAVVKANCNGCGDVMVSRLLDKNPQVCFAVSNIEEAVTVRESGTDREILILGYTPPELAADLAHYRITQTVLSLEYAARLAREAEEAGVVVAVHLKLDTGMSRIGLLCYDQYLPAAKKACRDIAGYSSLSITGVFTHIATFYNHDEDSAAFSRLQYSRFLRFTDEMKAEGISLGLRHCCNSPGAVNHPEMALDMVRVGTALLCGVPPAYDQKHLPWKQAVTIKSVVSCVKTIPQGAFVGYGRTFQAAEEMRLATISIGYSDICHIGSGKGYVLIRGQKCPVVGSVCMDQMMADISRVPDAALGDEVILVGKGVTLEEFAAFLSVGPEEAYCHITKRLPLLYIKNGSPIGFVRFSGEFEPLEESDEFLE